MAIFDEVKEIIVEQIGCDETAVTTDATFIEDLGADSLDIVEIMMALEEKYDVEIPDEDAEKIKKVADAVKYIEENQN